MSVAWMAPLPVWKEPQWATILRAGVRLVLAIFWATAAVLVPWKGPALIFVLFSLMALAHTALAVANRMKNHGVLLQLMGSGTLEWPRSLQEQWLRRPADWVDGAAIEVIPMDPIPVRAPAAPHVTLSGDSHEILRLPLYRRTMVEFMEEANAILAPRGVALVEQGTVRKPRGREGD